MGLKDSIAGQASMIAANNAVLMAGSINGQMANSLRPPPYRRSQKRYHAYQSQRIA